jgi:hypothetical protein
VRDAHGFEEFCSLHDFVVTAQLAFANRLVGVYVSACFVMRLDKSHAEWPVDSRWIRNGTLRTDVAGAANEVYYTGSQTADVFVVAAAVAKALEKESAALRGHMLPKIILAAQAEFFPGLAEEMGLCVLAPRSRASHCDTTETDELLLLQDEPELEPVVHTPHRVMSRISVAFLYLGAGTASAALAEALAENVRQRPDIDAQAIAIGPNSAHEVLQLRPSSRPFVVVIDSEDAEEAVSFHVGTLRVIFAAMPEVRPYGVHFVVRGNARFAQV